jgi:hypothetical protein
MIVRSYTATPIIRTPASTFMVRLCLANHLTSQSPWALERIEAMITGGPSPSPKEKKMMKALNRETPERETAIVKGSMTRELVVRALPWALRGFSKADLSYVASSQKRNSRGETPRPGRSSPWHPFLKAC